MHSLLAYSTTENVSSYRGMKRDALWCGVYSDLLHSSDIHILFPLFRHTVDNT